MPNTKRPSVPDQRPGSLGVEGFEVWNEGSVWSGESGAGEWDSIGFHGGEKVIVESLECGSRTTVSKGVVVDEGCYDVDSSQQQDGHSTG